MLTDGTVWTADDETGSFVDELGNALAQGWQVNVGLRNFAAIFDPEICDPREPNPVTAPGSSRCPR